ncbi:hypothetical protein ACWD9K_11370 [Streptomyces sp. 900116325]
MPSPAEADWRMFNGRTGTLADTDDACDELQHRVLWRWSTLGSAVRLLTGTRMA